MFPILTELEQPEERCTETGRQCVLDKPPTSERRSLRPGAQHPPRSGRGPNRCPSSRRRKTTPCHRAQNIASGSTATCGCRVASSGACIQWVATRRPSSTPAAASRKLPTHTEHTRLHVGAFFLTHWTKSPSRVTSPTKKAPGSASGDLATKLRDSGFIAQAPVRSAPCGERPQ